jgi:hypothetical protein
MFRDEGGHEGKNDQYHGLGARKSASVVFRFS